MGTVQRVLNINPSMTISDEKAVSLSVTQATPLSGRRLHSGGIFQLQPVGSVRFEIFQNRINFPSASSFGSRQTKYS